jgi:hypothetical protein
VGILVINGAPTLRIEIPGVAAVVVSLAIEDGRIARIYALSNPDKLTLLDTETLLTLELNDGSAGEGEASCRSSTIPNLPAAACRRWRSTISPLPRRPGGALARPGTGR